jgi:intracellular septation protein A
VTAEQSSGVPPVSIRSLVRESGPRLVVSGLGPVIAFYAGWKLQGLVLGVAMAGVVGLGAYAYEHMHGRPGFLARFVLAIVVIQAAVGLISRNVTLYFFQPVVVDSLIALLFLGSLATRRPLLGEFAREAYPFTQEVRDSATFRNVFGRITRVWGAYYVLRALVRLVGLASGDVTTILIVLTLSDAPFIVGLAGWSIWYAFRSFGKAPSPFHGEGSRVGAAPAAGTLRP